MLQHLNDTIEGKKEKEERDDVAHYAANLKLAKEKAKGREEDKKALFVTEELG